MSTATVEIESMKENRTKKRKSLVPLEAIQRHGLINTSLTAPTPYTNLEDNDEASEDVPRKKRKTSVEEIEVDVAKPEPPSKKALRRLKKGKPLPSPKSEAETTTEPDNEQPKKAEVEKRSEHGIWIGNLPWSASKADVITFLTTSSSIISDMITRIHMPSHSDDSKATTNTDTKPWKRQQHNKGFAYVDFTTPEAVPEAVLLSELLLSGRRVLIKDAKSFEGRPQKTKEEGRNTGNPPNRRIFVGNLRFDTTEENLREHFKKCGEVDDVMVATFEDSGKCKGYGWVTFKEIKAAQAAVRGWVLVEEEEEEDDDDEEEKDIKEEEEKEKEEKEIHQNDTHESNSLIRTDKFTPNKNPKPRFQRMKKTFLDKIHNRPIRREFAEDPQLRYKKRYGKDGTKAKSAAGAGYVDIETTEAKHVGDKENKVGRAEKVWPRREVEYPTTQVARLTGSIVEGKGKKVVF